MTHSSIRTPCGFSVASRRTLAAVFATMWAMPIQAAGEVDYTGQVKPILVARCVACHGALRHKGNLRLDTGAGARLGGDDGPAVTQGKATASLLIERVMATDPAFRMPPEGAALSGEQIATLKKWIDQGARSPADEQVEADPREHWSFGRVVRPAVPEIKDQAWVRNPIDAFIAHEREKRGLGRVGPASPEILLRRVTLDLTGLPPTRNELQEFVRDPSDVAYERVVERLLASPRYGERWARHWMDVWRYSDWYGRRAVPDVLNSYAQIWRWRDWIVKSLNRDRGYDQMVREMLAADELVPGDDENVVATGFLVRNWFRWNTNLWMKDNVEHTGKAFLGLTMNCAHCHDHKYDPIKHDDYFAFRAFFEPLELRHDRVPGELDPGPYPKYVYGSAYPPIRSGMIRVFDEKLDAPTFFYTGGEFRNIVAGRAPVAAGVPAFLGAGSIRITPVDLPVEVSRPWLKPFVIREERERRLRDIAAAERSREPSLRALEAVERDLARLEKLRRQALPTRAFADQSLEVPAFAWREPAVSSELEQARKTVRHAQAAAKAEEAKLASARSELEAFDARVAADLTRYGKREGNREILRQTAVCAERRNAVDLAALGLAKSELEAIKSEGKAQAEIAKTAAGRAAASRRLDEARAMMSRDPGSTEYAAVGPVFPARSSGKRAALARWITDRANPLAARVAVNHLWRWHFGTGLVETTYDFGRNGKRPTHPELLDWLAMEMMEPAGGSAGPWSMKALHRLMVTSATYRMGSRPPDTAAPRDDEKRWYGHFSSNRMEAEEIRDSVLYVADTLDPMMFGPDLDHSFGLTSRRRSLYFTHHGESRMQFLELFDAADACDGYRRSVSIVPQQALAIVNNAMLVELSARLADRLWSELAALNGGGSREAVLTQFVDAVFEQVLSRRPTIAEQKVCREFLRKQNGLLASSGDAKTSSTADARARAGLIHALFSHNDFVTIH